MAGANQQVSWHIAASSVIRENNIPPGQYGILTAIGAHFPLKEIKTSWSMSDVFERDGIQADGKARSEQEDIVSLMTSLSRWLILLPIP